MKVLLHTQEIDVDCQKTIGNLLEYLKLSPSTAVVLKNGDIVEAREHYKEEDVIEIVKVMSGG